MKIRRKITALIATVLALVLLCPSVSAALSPSASGSKVKAMQQKLISLGYMTSSAGGTYNTATKNAVEIFENANGLTSDGIADDTMLSSLDRLYNGAGKITVTGTNVNVRSNAGTKYSRIGTAKKGASYVVLGTKKVSGVTWYNFMYGTKRAWIVGTYVKYTSPASYVKTGKTAAITGSTVNVRSGAGTKYSKVTSLKKGAVIVVSGSKSVSGKTWYSYVSDGRTLWVIGTYASAKSCLVLSEGSGNTTHSTTTATTTSTKPTTASTTAAPQAKEGTTTASYLNARKGAGSSYGVVKSLPKGTVIEITGSKTVSGQVWYSFTDSGRTLWVSGQYVKVTTTAATTTTTTTTTTTSSTRPTAADTENYIFGTVDVNTNLNVRVGAGSGYAKLGTLAKDEQIVICKGADKNGWYRIIYGNELGWVSSDYVDTVDRNSLKIKTENNVLARAEAILADMTTEEKVGQLLLLECDDFTKEEFTEILSRCKAGGVVLYGGDVIDKTPEEVKALVADYQNASDGKMLIGIDEEGGTVVRLSSQPQLRSTAFRSPQELYNLGGLDLIKADTINKCSFLRGYGVNLNFAPVADVTTSSDGYMYKRAFGGNAKETGEYVTAVVSSMNESGVASSMKHFPGYGNSTADTHEGLDHNTKTLEDLMANDFVPFREGIKAGADSIMMTHTVIEAVDDKNPASLSVSCTDLVREELGFEGVIVSDALDMGAIKEFCGDTEPSVLAVLGGCDLLCTPDDPVAAYNNLLAAVENGTITEKRLDESVKRILVMKIEMGLYS